MTRFGSTFTVIGMLLAIFVGGCSLVVDFDRSLLLDSGVDAGIDGGADQATSAEVNSSEDPSGNAAVDLGADAGVAPDAS